MIIDNEDLGLSSGSSPYEFGLEQREPEREDSKLITTQLFTSVGLDNPLSL
jgi:hypothetical protein